MNENYYDVQFNCNKNRVPDSVSSRYTAMPKESVVIFPQAQADVTNQKAEEKIETINPENDASPETSVISEDSNADNAVSATDTQAKETNSEKGVVSKTKDETATLSNKKDGIITVTIDGKEYELPYEEHQMEDGTVILTGIDKKQGICYSNTVDKDGNMLCESVIRQGSRTYWDYQSGIVEETTYEPDNPFSQITQRYSIESGNFIDVERNEVISLNKTQRGSIDSDGNFIAYEEPASYWAPNISETSANIANLLTDMEQEQASISEYKSVTENLPNYQDTNFGALTIKESATTSPDEYVDNSQSEKTEDIQDSSSSNDTTRVVFDSDNKYKQLISSFQLPENGGYDEEDAIIFAGKYLQYLEKGFSEEQAFSMSIEYAQTYSDAINDEKFSAKQINDYMKFYNHFLMQGLSNEDAQDMAAQQII